MIRNVEIDEVETAGHGAITLGFGGAVLDSDFLNYSDAAVRLWSNGPLNRPGNVACSGAADRARRALNRAGAGTCVDCGRAFIAARIEIDHRCPLADGGTDTDGNIDIRCRPCHQAKTTLEHRNRTRSS